MSEYEFYKQYGRYPTAYEVLWYGIDSDLVWKFDTDGPTVVNGEEFHEVGSAAFSGVKLAAVAVICYCGYQVFKNVF